MDSFDEHPGTLDASAVARCVQQGAARIRRTSVIRAHASAQCFPQVIAVTGEHGVPGHRLGHRHLRGILALHHALSIRVSLDDLDRLPVALQLHKALLVLGLQPPLGLGALQVVQLMAVVGGVRHPLVAVSDIIAAVACEPEPVVQLDPVELIAHAHFAMRRRPLLPRTLHDLRHLPLGLVRAARAAPVVSGSQRLADRLVERGFRELPGLRDEVRLAWIHHGVREAAARHV